MAARYRNSEEKLLTRRDIEMSMVRKLADPDIRGDITALLRPGIELT